MAKARMLHKSISVSEQVSNLSLPSQLLFTWLIPHADDEGRIKGNPKYIKVMVVPSLDWKPEQIHEYLEEIAKQGLVYYWNVDGQQYIEFPNWKRYQYIAKDRFHKSELPAYVDSSSTSRIQGVDNLKTEANVSEMNKEEIKKSEVKHFADKSFLDPDSYEIKSNEEYAAYMAWKKLEPDNKAAFYTTYLPAAKKGVSADTIHRFASETHQDKTVENKGSVFQSKVKSVIK